MKMPHPLERSVHSVQSSELVDKHHGYLKEKSFFKYYFTEWSAASTTGTNKVEDEMVVG